MISSLLQNLPLYLENQYTGQKILIREKINARDSGTNMGVRDGQFVERKDEVCRWIKPFKL